jgi:hypothetical protein
MKTLLTADLHLEDRILTEYRWNFFYWLADTIQSNSIKKLIILGDITEKKDNHSARLTNRIVDTFLEISKLCEITILKGNHDSYDYPFFTFLNNLNNVNFIDQVNFDINNDLYIPYTKDLEEFKNILKDFEGQKIRTIYLHQTLNGFKAMNNFTMTSNFDKHLFSKLKYTSIFSGDLHLAQEQLVGDSIIRYVGSPYPIYFGDNDYKGTLYITDVIPEDRIFYDCGISRWSKELTFEGFRSFKNTLRTNDQIKLKILLEKSEFGLWEEIKKEVKSFCKEGNINLVALSLKPVERDSVKILKSVSKIDDSKIFTDFIAKEKLSDFYSEVGKEVMV